MVGGFTRRNRRISKRDDEMREHCHLHFIVTAGGLDSHGRWVAAGKDFLLPTPVLASKFWGKFIAYLKEGFSKLTVTGKQ
ncbi:MAG: transposase [Desulfobacterales bacterium]|nr:transposase [Desulfobacterales bacterium]